MKQDLLHSFSTNFRFSIAHQANDKNGGRLEPES